MKTFSAEESLWLALPILIILVGLVAALALFQNQGAEVRSKASEPTPIITPRSATPIKPQAPEVVCTSMYSPVCGIDQNTYSSACEAALNGILNYRTGICPSATPQILPTVRE